MPSNWSRRGVLAALLACAGCEGPAPHLGLALWPVKPLPPPIDLRADANRDGVTDLEDPADDEGEETWTAQRGAIFLANLDDDLRSCPRSAGTTDVALAACHDAADDLVNGQDDLEDMAVLRVRAWPGAPDGTTARLDVPAAAASKVRFFIPDGRTWSPLYPGAALPLELLRAGIELRLEGRDIVRDAAWNGFVDVTLAVDVPAQAQWEAGTHRDTVRLRVAPVLTFSHAEPVVKSFVSNVTWDSDSQAFQAALGEVLTAANPAIVLDRPVLDDQWTQDLFETGYMAMPAPGGQKVITVFLRSANIENPGSPESPLREAGRVVFTRFRGPDVAGIQQFDLATSEDEQTLNSMGNYEVIPPFEHDGKAWPLGRAIRGRIATYSPDQGFVAMTAAQAWQQPSLDVDTSWLLVGHVDETIAFLKASTPRGWVVLANDARLAKQMLEAEVERGNGGVPMFVGKSWMDDYGRETSAEVTIAQALANPDVMGASAEAEVKVEAQLALLKAATGITDADIVRFPFLHEPAYGFSLAWQPGTVNLLVLDQHHVVVADPHGPVIDGKDLFKAHLEAALAPYQVTVHWVDDWNLYHRLAGEVHCGTNSLRRVPSQKWWEVTP